MIGAYGQVPNSISEAPGVDPTSNHGPFSENDMIGSSPVATIGLGKVSTGCILDTGAETSLMPISFYNKYLKDEFGNLSNSNVFIRVLGANGQEVPIEGYVIVPLTVGNVTLPAGFLVRSELEQNLDRYHSHPIILGCNILRK